MLQPNRLPQSNTRCNVHSHWQLPRPLWIQTKLDPDNTWSAERRQDQIRKWKIKKNEDELKNMIAEREEDINRQLKEKIAESEAQLLKDKEAAMSKIEEISQAAAYAVIQKLGLETVTAEDIRNAAEAKGK